MPLDATYQQLMRMLAARGLDWTRQRVMDLPDPLSPNHPAAAQVAQLARLAPVLSGLRGHMSPLEDIAARRLCPVMVREASERGLTGKMTATLRELIAAGELVSGDDPAWQMARLAVVDDPETDLADRLALAVEPMPELMAEAEAAICAQIPQEVICDARISRFARLLMQVYRFGAARPPFADARSFGHAHEKARRFAEWARRKGRVVALAQSLVCLRLLDPDHDMAEDLSEIISSQRPDGSFPEKVGFSTADQDLRTGLEATMIVLITLHLCAYGGWRRSRRNDPILRPLTRSRDRLAAAIAPRVDEWVRRQRPAEMLDLAAALTRATGENWFNRCGLTGYRPGQAGLTRLAGSVFCDAHAARHARQTLDLEQDFPTAWRDDPELRWLNGAAVMMRRDDPGRIWSRWNVDDLAVQGGVFDRCCRDALIFPPATPDAALRGVIRAHGLQILRIAERPDSVNLQQASTYLRRACMIAQLFEPAQRLAAAA
ncbi:hypothetical protein J7376_07830 [Paracoccus sp. R12_1]|uniref:hypothetical protein n=1 Tax=Paracoccus sp. TaxID=267 RepID=UPI001B008D7D|nr:hypothetical protein [Paracoccus sp. R12_2]MBO9486424.1 hypothetical protein [Paracoccus sp. R12_1]